MGGFTIGVTVGGGSLSALSHTHVSSSLFDETKDGKHDVGLTKQKNNKNHVLWKWARERVFLVNAKGEEECFMAMEGFYHVMLIVGR